MTLDKGQSLGYGVSVITTDDGGMEVHSEFLDFPWTAKQGKTPGSAILFENKYFQVISTLSTAQEYCWTLEAWPETETFRTVFRLDADEVDKLNQKFHVERKATQKQWWTVIFAPLLGLAPRPIQNRWQNEWGYPANMATGISAMTELILTGICVIDVVASMTGGAGILPKYISWISLFAPLFFAEAIYRLDGVFRQSKATGSLLGLPLLLFIRVEPVLPAPISVVPVVHKFDEEQGYLEFVSNIIRRDWNFDGLLLYHDEIYQLEISKKVGNGWLYQFQRRPDCSKEPDLRLLPPPTTKYQSQRSTETPNFFFTILVSTLVCLAPRIYQERWSKHIGLSPIWLTLLGAGGEIIGGVSSLGADMKSHSMLLLLDVFLLGEGFLRLFWTAFTKQPIGSLMGIPLKSLFEKWT